MSEHKAESDDFVWCDVRWLTPEANGSHLLRAQAVVQGLIESLGALERYRDPSANSTSPGATDERKPS